MKPLACGMLFTERGFLLFTERGFLNEQNIVSLDAPVAVKCLCVCESWARFLAAT